MLRTTAIVPALVPNKALKKPKTQKYLLEKASKSTSPPILRFLALETIDSYPNTNIKAFTDGSDVRVVRNGGYLWICDNDTIKRGTNTPFRTL